MDSFFSLILKYDAWIRFFHIAGAIIALGSVTVSDLFLLWLKFKPKAASQIARIAPLFSLQVWLGLMLLSASGFLMLLPRQGIETNFFFKLKMILVLIIFLNGIFLNVWVTPKFEALVPEWHKNTKKVKNFMVIAGIVASVSFIGWWSVIVIMTIFY